MENEFTSSSIGTEQLASTGQRIAASLIDFILVGILGRLIPFFNLGSLIGLVYLLTRDSLPFLNGQSIGKKLMKIRAVTEEGQSLSEDWKTGAIRNILLIVPGIGALIELVVLLTNKDLRRLGDQWAKTKVIVEPGA